MKISKPKLGIIGSVGVPANYGGFETLAHQLVLKLNKQLDITVYNSALHYKKEERVPEWNGAKIKYIPLDANGCQSIFYDIFSIIHAIRFCDVLLILGVSGCLILPFIKLFSRKKIIVNVDGLEWRRAKWGPLAKAFLIFSERIAIWAADEIITDNEAIQKYVHDHYAVNSYLIEYGADHNQALEIAAKDTIRYPFLLHPYAFKVARIEPENNIHLVLEAFSQQSDLPLVLVGNWDNSNYGKKLRSQYKAFGHLHLLDPIYDKPTLNVLRSNARLYIHGHSAGGTNPSLIEAMHLGLPVLSFDAIYNRITTERKAIYFSDQTELSSWIKTYRNRRWKNQAKAMKEIATRRYKWEVIATKYAQLIQGTAIRPKPVFDFELPVQLRKRTSKTLSPIAKSY